MEEMEEELGWVQVSVTAAEDDVASTGQEPSCKYDVPRALSMVESGLRVLKASVTGPQPTA